MENNNKIKAGAQALQNIKTKFPEHAPQFINKAMQKIKAARRSLDLENTPADNHEAVLHCMKLGDGLNSAHCLLAAEYLLNHMQELESKHISTEQRIFKIEKQLEKLPSCNWKDQDKANFTAYYQRQFAKVKATIDPILFEIIETAKSLGIPQPDDIYNAPIGYRHGRDSLAATA